jgi:hypothetical protein
MSLHFVMVGDRDPGIRAANDGAQWIDAVHGAVEEASIALDRR